MQYNSSGGGEGRTRDYVQYRIFCVSPVMIVVLFYHDTINYHVK